jgi:hypothetical protein
MSKKTVGKAMVRCKALSMSDLAAQEKHGKRLDGTSKKRVIRNDPAIVYRSLDLRAEYDRHIEGVRLNTGAKKPVLHFIVRFPPGLLEPDFESRRFNGLKKKRQREMLAQAVTFIQETHGSDAVFAARLDRDEEGETIVDVFASPKYEKRTKRTKPDETGVIWASATKFGKDLAEKHQPEMRRRFPKAKAGLLTSPRMVGIALQSEFAAFFEKANGFAFDRKVEKESATPDRLETEALKRLRSERQAMEAEYIEKKDALDDWGHDLAEKAADLEKRETRLGWIKDRVMGLVKAFGEAFGLPLPKSMHDAVAALEDEMKQRAGVRDPFLKSSAKDPFDDAGPGF